MTDNDALAQLKACPHCGADGYNLSATQHYNVDMTLRDSWQVECSKCAAFGPDAKTEAEAIAAWNTRTPSPVAGEVGEPVAWALQWPLNRENGRINHFTVFPTRLKAESYAKECSNSDTITVVPLYTADILERRAGSVVSHETGSDETQDGLCIAGITQPTQQPGDQAEKPASPAQWLPIESAPKDGTPIILGSREQTYQGKPVEPRVTIGHWTTEEECKEQIGDCGGECRCPEYKFHDPEWRSWDGGFTEENPPEAWMPLPAPPAALPLDGEG